MKCKFCGRNVKKKREYISPHDERFIWECPVDGTIKLYKLIDGDIVHRYVKESDNL